MIQWEIASEPSMVGAVWHPAVMVEAMAAACTWPWHEVVGGTAESIMEQLPKSVKERLK
jgi:hypothetical protein